MKEYPTPDSVVKDISNLTLKSPSKLIPEDDDSITDDLISAQLEISELGSARDQYLIDTYEHQYSTIGTRLLPPQGFSDEQPVAEENDESESDEESESIEDSGSDEMN